MSMQGILRQISPDQLQEIIENPSNVDELFRQPVGYWDGENGGIYDMDWAWNGLHYLLTGITMMEDEGMGEPPLSYVVLEANSIDWEVGYGPPGYLTPEQVAEVATALQNVSPEEFVQKYDLKAMEGLYGIHGYSDEPKALLNTLEGVKGFYQNTAEKGHAMLCYII